MARKKANLKGTLGFRYDCQDFFKYEIAGTAHLKHQVPYIFILNGVAQAVYYTRDLMKLACDEDIILKGWQGQWKTDIFSFKFKDLREYIEKENVRI
jgi:hypothetical protein